MARITLKESCVIFNKENHTYELNRKMLQGITTMLQRQLFSTEYEGIPWAIVKKPENTVHKYMIVVKILIRIGTTTDHRRCRTTFPFAKNTVLLTKQVSTP